MRKTVVTLVLSLVSLLTFAQQDAQFSMFMFNRLQINPAYAGINKTLCVNTLYRQQWVGFGGAPKTGLLSIDYGHIAKIKGGLGLTIDQDQIGFSQILKAKIAYAFHKRLNVGTISFGVDGGMIQKTLKGDFVDTYGNKTSTGGGNDQAIPWSGTNVTTYDVGFGAYYQTNKLHLGLSSLHLPEQTVTANGSSSLGDWDYNFKAARHYYIMAGYKFRAGRVWEITPSVLAKSVIATTQADINIMAKWNRKLFAGFTYRLSDAYVVMAGLESPLSKQLTARVGYSYDITSSDIKKYSNGSHEFMLGFCYKIVPDPTTTSHMNVRFL